MRKVGLTGGIASGKTVAAEAFAALGAPVIDTDTLALDATAPGSEGFQAIIDAFGRAYIDDDGYLDRAKLRQYVFAHPAERKRLEAIVHPLVRARLEDWLGTLDHPPYAIIVVPLLIETGMDKEVDRVLVVDCPETAQLERLQARDGETPESARAILAAQSDRATRLAAADDIIRNDGPPAALRDEVRRLDTLYREMK